MNTALRCGMKLKIDITPSVVSGTEPKKVPIEAWCRLCDVLGIAPDNTIEDVVARAKLLSKIEHDLARRLIRLSAEVARADQRTRGNQKI